VKSLGADVVIDYKTTRFEDVARDQDVVFDTQAGETLLRSFSAVKAGGVVVTVGGRPDAKFARTWGLSLPLVWILGFLNCVFRLIARRRSGPSCAAVPEHRAQAFRTIARSCSG